MKELLELYKKVYPNSDGADFHNFIRSFHIQIPITEEDKKYQEQREQAARIFLEQRL